MFWIGSVFFSQSARIKIIRKWIVQAGFFYRNSEDRYYLLRFIVNMYANILFHRMCFVCVMGLIYRSKYIHIYFVFIFCFIFVLIHFILLFFLLLRIYLNRIHWDQTREREKVFAIFSSEIRFFLSSSLFSVFLFGHAFPSVQLISRLLDVFY